MVALFLRATRANRSRSLNKESDFERKSEERKSKFLTMHKHMKILNIQTMKDHVFYYFVHNYSVFPRKYIIYSYN